MSEDKLVERMRAEGAANFWIAIRLSQGRRLAEILAEFGIEAPDQINREEAAGLLARKLMS